MLGRKHVSVIGVHNNISKAFFRMERDTIALHESNTTIVFKSIIEWYVVKCGLKELTPKQQVFRGVGLHAQFFKHNRLSYLHDIVQFLRRLYIIFVVGTPLKEIGLCILGLH